jgi:hypothetical protein
MSTVTEDDLREMIAYALSHRLNLRPQSRRLGASRIWANAVVEYLKLCGVILEQKPPLKGLSVDYAVGTGQTVGSNASGPGSTRWPIR